MHSLTGPCKQHMLKCVDMLPTWVEVHQAVGGGVDALEARPQERLQGGAVKALGEAVGGDAPPTRRPFNLQVFEDAWADAIGRRCACYYEGHELVLLPQRGNCLQLRIATMMPSGYGMDCCCRGRQDQVLPFHLSLLPWTALRASSHQ
jgi:hypothetical protein